MRLDHLFTQTQHIFSSNFGKIYHNSQTVHRYPNIHWLLKTERNSSKFFLPLSHENCSLFFLIQDCLKVQSINSDFEWMEKVQKSCQHWVRRVGAWMAVEIKKIIIPKPNHSRDRLDSATTESSRYLLGAFVSRTFFTLHLNPFKILFFSLFFVFFFFRRCFFPQIDCDLFFKLNICNVYFSVYFL